MNPKRNPPVPLLDGLKHIGRDPAGIENTGGSVIAIKLRTRFSADYELAIAFLSSYVGSTATFNSYRRDIERLLQWCWTIESKSIVSVTRDDVDRFMAFFKKPPAAWVGNKNVARFKTANGVRVANPSWRPFVDIPSKKNNDQSVAANKCYSPSDSSTVACYLSLSTFFEYLIEQGEIDRNPVKMVRQKTKYVSSVDNLAPVRRLSNFQWDYVIETVREMAEKNPEEHERSLFIMSALYCMYLRISELVSDERSSPVMSDFYKDLDGNWWFRTVGKGKKARDIVVSEEMLAALKRYRLHLGLSPYPMVHKDSHPLLTNHRDGGPITSTGHVRRIVQLCFDAALQKMQDDGLGADDTYQLKSATVHWIRHTAISEDVKIRPREHVKADAGHESWNTTERYINSDNRERHSSGANKPITGQTS